MRAAAPKLDEIPCFDTTCSMEIVTAIINPAASIPAPRKRIRLRPVVQVTAISDAESSDHDRDIAARHIVPDDLLHVVDSIEVRGRSHIAVPLAAVARDDNEVQVVLQRFSGWIGPHESDFEGCGLSSCAA